jgi:hypothetical protein
VHKSALEGKDNGKNKSVRKLEHQLHLLPSQDVLEV